MNQPAELTWREGQVPVSQRFDDPYFSLENGLEETAYVFLDGNDLPARFRDGFHIAELGFGTGLNLLAALALWRESNQSGKLHFTSFEAFPMAPKDMLAAQAAFPALAALSDELAPHWTAGETAFQTDDLVFTLVLGDARKTVSNIAQKADAWFLDGFSPAKNPELWEPALMAQIAAQTAPQGTAATYTAAGFVRRALAEAGFDVTRRTGFGRKRHMTTARML
ncbi:MULTISPECIES: tRNA (5-methylaminomethyl-2-thiouridine)(34)-methyltransferase MnmD [Lentibacter]|jgi:tRNA U34 5-methylaminomethyl-2-thiouridine-forming methyltransferase MnmC|uniref:tRNA U34 5-methylaminomethyl-2-thiouridine-forming methyltransferase MnmC n=1 Tax=Lentibacter algarum TaxID=576131 RepID=A0A1H3MEM3_9RHOB|nr:tRNA (5-methylaminomethyl-2-thiouridine)(34)-methyltransferase MnmD [Lentibacter algarum]MCO4828657.1 tRNA (5-methylaminomethyl-2-thiouridine)(34)-methyltransferase MnmD [Lentibacter algarum]WIF33061.1 tRNA 5-methylaminomethyl-2-thiouridine biosynthesis bifunctional protein MnmC-like protein [Lentibacter algarum]SDY74639.1 tRNA U34 5-methylaminomethyl-2-thiouridine-forming methyltransferase MnmC [Lentibacter algarum]